MRSYIAPVLVVFAACKGSDPIETGPVTETDTTVADTDTGEDSGWYNGDLFDLSLTGSAYNPHIGEPWWLGLFDSAGAFVDYDDGTVAGDGTVSAYLFGSLDLDQTYRLDLIADADGDRLCDAVPTDHAWRYDVPAVTANVSLVAPHSTSFTDAADVCEAWRSWHHDVTLTGTGFNVHAGQDVHYALVDAGLQQVYFTSSEVVASDGTIAVAFPDAFAANTPFLDLVWYADSNGTTGCQPLSDGNPDPQWSLPVLNAAADVALSYAHDVAFTDVCWAFAP